MLSRGVKMPNKINWILDPGHPGMAFDQYLIRGKQSPQVPPGIYEGKFNRSICDTITCYQDAVVTVPGPINVPLSTRVKFARQLNKRIGNCALISVHANAAGKSGWSGANGFAIFHSRQASEKSKLLARIVEEELSSGQDRIKSRGIKKANFSIITLGQKKILNGGMPSILVELGFMTNWDEAALLAKAGYRWILANLVSQSMTRYESEVG